MTTEDSRPLGPWQETFLVIKGVKRAVDIRCVGMYDFQVVEDVNIALVAMRGTRERPRRWTA